MNCGSASTSHSAVPFLHLVLRKRPCTCAMLKLATRATLLHATDMFSPSPRCALLLVRCSTNTAAGRWSSHRELVPQRCIASSVPVYQASPSSTSSEQSSSQQPSPSPPGAWNKLKTMIKAFTNGSKLVYKDFKRMREIKGRAKGFFPLTAEKLKQLSSGEAVSPITREEFVFMINVRGWCVRYSHVLP